MIERTKNAQLWNQEVLNSNPTPIRKEYSQAMADYLNLKLDYYTKMEKGIELTLNKDLEGAKTQYNEAKKLIPQIKKQEKLLETIQNKDPEFKNYISIQIKNSENYAQMKKQKNELLSSQFFPPENN